MKILWGVSQIEPKLTAAEIGVLWATYMYASTNECMLKYCYARAEDREFREAFSVALCFLPERMRGVEDFFRQEDIPVPAAFSEEDVETGAPRLFSDTFAISYLRHRGAVSTAALSFGLYVTARPDVRGYLREQLITSMNLNKRVSDIMLERGIYVRAPYVPVGGKVEFAGSKGFLGSLFGGGRPLTTPEITHLYHNTQTNSIGKDMVVGFSQVARSPEIRAYFRRGADIADKHMDVFSQALRREDIPDSTSPDSHVTASTVPPFSDKYMLIHVSLLNSLGLTNYGLALGSSLRADLQADYVRLSAEVMEYGRDGMNIALRHGWLEEPPQAVDRRELALHK